MTSRQVRRRYIWAAILGILSGSGFPMLMAAEGSQHATETFWTAAEKFGVYAAINMALIAVLVFLLYRQTSYNQNRMEQVVDDNTLCFHRFVRTMAARPCISNSDVDKIIDPENGEDSSDPVVKRVQARHKARTERTI